MLKRYFLTFVIVSGLLVGIFSLTRPDQLPSAILVVVFALLYVQLAVLLLLAVLVVNKLGRFAWAPSTLRRLAGSAAVLPVFLLLLQSIGQLTWRDFLLSVAFAVLGYFYFVRFVAKKNEQGT